MSLLEARRKLRALARAEGEVEINNAAVALSVMPGRHVQRGLERLLVTHEVPRVRAMAAWALGFQSMGSDAAASLLRVLGDREEEADVRAHAAEAIGHLADRLGSHEPAALAALLHALRDESADVRFWAAFALGNLGDEAAIPALERLAARDFESIPGWWSVRKEANDSIAQILLRKGNRGAADGAEGP